jgi:protein gp37
MRTQTGISWADKTWNPWVGCTPVSEGCANCYARREMTRYGKDFSTVKRTSAKTFNLPLAKKRDGSWKIPDGSFVFVCSWSDFFHEGRATLRLDDWRDEAIGIMAKRQGLTFLVLTKRPDIAQDYLRTILMDMKSRCSHIWLGVTAENQAMADERIPKLLKIDWPGRKFVSVEPMLEAVDLEIAWGQGVGDLALDASLHTSRLDWIICGGESGPGARAFDADWARGLRDQCAAAGVPFWMKQMGGWPDKRKKLEDLPEDLRIRERP